jgi:hypothetical protein
MSWRTLPAQLCGAPRQQLSAKGCSGQDPSVLGPGSGASKPLSGPEQFHLESILVQSGPLGQLFQGASLDFFPDQQNPFIFRDFGKQFVDKVPLHDNNIRSGMRVGDIVDHC